MLASILIATFNRDSLLKLNLDSLAKQNLNKNKIEIIVINDGLNTIQTQKLVEKYSNILNIKYIFSGKRNSPKKNIWRNPGFAYNYGVHFSSGEYLFICGAEIYHENETIQFMLDDIAKEPNSMVIPHGLDDRDGAYTEKLIFNNSKNLNIKLFELNTKLPFLMCFKRSSFLQINGYDEDMIGIGYDDDDIVTRLNKIGLNYKQSSARITHLFHKRTPDNYVSETIQNPKILHDKLVYLNNQIYELGKNKNPIRNINKEWGKNNIWYLKNIPRKIHFYWGDPSEYMSYLRYLSIYSAVCNNPDFEIYLHLPAFPSKNKRSWNTSEQATDVYSSYNWFHDVKKLNINIIKHDFDKCGFSNERHEVQKSDFIRWIVLFEFGGFWSDMDIFYSKSLYELSCNIPENYFIDTGIHIYSDFKSHAIGFLFSSINNKLFIDCHNIASENFKNTQNDNYQSFGSDILNNNFKTINEIKRKHSSLSILNIEKDTVYRASPTELDINNLYSEGTFVDAKKEVGIHWFGGHPLSREFEKNFEEFNKETFKNKLSNYIVKYFEKNNLKIIKNNIFNNIDNTRISFILINNDFLDLNSTLLNFLNQNNKNFEVILITSNDEKEYEKLQKFLNLKIIKLIKNIPINNQIDIGIENCKSEYISILTEDFIFSENYIEVLINNLSSYCPNIILNNVKNNKTIVYKDAVVFKKTFFVEKNILNNLSQNISNTDSIIYTDSIVYLNETIIIKSGCFNE